MKDEIATLIEACDTFEAVLARLDDITTTVVCGAS